MYNLLRVQNMIVTDIRGGSKVSQISCILRAIRILIENLENFNGKI